MSDPRTVKQEGTMTLTAEDFACFQCGHWRSHHLPDPRDSRGSGLAIGQGRWTVCSGEFVFSQSCRCSVYQRGYDEIRHDKAVREASLSDGSVR